MTSRSAGSASYKRNVVTAVPSGCVSQMKYGRWSTGIDTSEFAICVAKYEPLMNVVDPGNTVLHCLRRRSSIDSSPILRSGFGVFSVSGRSRVPRPAAKIRMFIRFVNSEHPASW